MLVWISRALLLLVALLVALLVLLYFLLAPIETKLVYWADKTEYLDAFALENLNGEYKALELEAHDGVTLVAAELMHQNAASQNAASQNAASQNEDKKWLIHFHGNASNHRAYVYTLERVMQEIEINVLFAEYRGFYKSEGKPNEADISQDARLYYDYLIEKGVEGKDIILYGYSLGTGVAVDLAAEVDVAALLLEAPYTSLPDVAKSAYGNWLPTQLMRNRFESIKKIDKINAPLFVMHGTLDEVIPFEQGVQVFEGGLEPKGFFSFQGGHEGSPETIIAAKNFLKQQGVLNAD